jgi:2-oxoglutarate ferredoxin oxidoreductase subunit alpha
MNHWMAEEFKYPDVDMDRGKFLWEEDIENFGQKWGRYLDADGDGIPYRTFPGNKNSEAAYFARGTGHDEYAAYTEDHEDWEVNMARLTKKFETGKQYLPKPVLVGNGDADIGIIAYGSTEPAIVEACDKLKAQGIEVDFLRLRALPLLDEVKEFIDFKERVYTTGGRSKRVH